MNDDLIKKSDAIKALGDEPMVWTLEDEYTMGQRSQWRADVTAIESIPSADRPQGEWIDDGRDAIGVMGVGYRWYKCSQCGFGISKSLSAYYPKFCEHCGAKMKGADDE